MGIYTKSFLPWAGGFGGHFRQNPSTTEILPGGNPGLRHESIGWFVAERHKSARSAPFLCV